MSYDLSIVQLRETAAQFRASLPVPSALQLCVETDTGRAFSGDGATVITSLLDLKLTGEERTHADLVWDQMRLGDGRDEVGEGAEPGDPVVFAPGIAYTFNTDQTSDPAAGTFRFNNGNILGATEMYVHKTDASANTHDQSGWFNLMTSGVAKVFCESGNVLTLSVTRMTVTGDVYTFSIARTSGAKPTSNENCYVDFVPDAPGVIAYEAHFNQKGTANPTLTVITDSFGEAVSFVRASQGTYTLTIPSIVDITTVDVIIGAQQAENQDSGNLVRPYYNVSSSSINGYDITDNTIVDFNMSASAYFHIKLTF